MKVSDIMSRQIAVIPPDTSLQEAARIMRDLDVGFLPVAQEGKLVGVITDRDIACRAVATGVQPATAIGHAMTKGVMHCREDQDIAEAARLMATKQIRRLPVLNRAGHLAGILSVSDLALRASHKLTAQVIEAISCAPGRTIVKAGMASERAGPRR